MSRLTELCFELNQPYPPKFKAPYFKIPITSSYIFEEILRDIHKIVNNSDHQQSHEYTEAVKTFKRIKCWFYLCLILSILIASGWSAFIFFLCDFIQMDNCDYMDYHNIINQILWTLFCFLFLSTLLLIICGLCIFSHKTKRITQKWRISIKTQIHRYIEKRRKTSPQYLFELNYRATNGFIIIRRSGAKTPSVDTDSKEYTYDISANKKKKKKKKRLKIDNIQIESVSHNINQELAHLNAVNTTPITEYSVTSHNQQISTEMLQEYARANNSMLNALINAPSRPNLHQDVSNSKSNTLNVTTPYKPDKSAPNHNQQNSGSASNRNLYQMQYGTSGSGLNLYGNPPMNDINNGNVKPNNVSEYQVVNQSRKVYSSQTDLAMKQLPPVIPNPVDLDAINKPIHQQNAHFGYDYPQNNHYKY